MQGQIGTVVTSVTDFQNAAKVEAEAERRERAAARQETVGLNNNVAKTLEALSKNQKTRSANEVQLPQPDGKSLSRRGVFRDPARPWWPVETFRRMWAMQLATVISSRRAVPWVLRMFCRHSLMGRPAGKVSVDQATGGRPRPLRFQIVRVRRLPSPPLCYTRPHLSPVRGWQSLSRTYSGDAWNLQDVLRNGSAGLRRCLSAVIALLRSASFE